MKLNRRLPSIKTRVFFGDELGTFHAIDAATGKKKWEFKADAGIISSANFAEIVWYLDPMTTTCIAFH